MFPIEATEEWGHIPLDEWEWKWTQDYATMQYIFLFRARNKIIIKNVSWEKIYFSQKVCKNIAHSRVDTWYRLNDIIWR